MTEGVKEITEADVEALVAIEKEDDIPEPFRKMVATIKRYDKRMKDYAAGVPKLQKAMDADPGSIRVVGLKKRMEEYQSGLRGLPLYRQKAIFDLWELMKKVAKKAAQPTT